MKAFNSIRWTLSAALLLLSGQLLFAQTQFPWPVTPFNQSHWITGTFCEYRSTTNPAHFHNGTDIPKADGSPVYAVTDGVVVSMATSGSNAYIRVGDKAYVHIQPNPALSVGDPVVASQTVIGHILSGLGHVHFTNGYVGSEHNAMLMNSGLTPLIDDWAPIIRFVKFYQNNTTNEFPANAISGFIDIVVKVDEQNGAPGSPTSVLNNGTYKIGYKILSADSSSVVFEPPNNGLRFQFDTKPSNSYVDIVYFQSLSSTTSHVYQVTNDVWHDNYWDTTVLPEGNYVVMAFTEDTRQNTDTVYVPVTVAAVDTTAPAPPRLKYTLGTSNAMKMAWYPNSDPDLLGYRVYFSFDNINWSLFRDETYFTAAVTDTTLPMVLNTDIYYRVTAVDNSPLKNESKPSDVYGLSNGNSFHGKILIVDGFDRTDGGWTRPYHDFGFTYGKAVIGNQFSFDTASDEAVSDGSIDLNDYDMVAWFTGDDALPGEIFDSTAQALIRTYLENGGNLVVSGSHIARALDTDGAGTATPADDQFLHQYLKADFAGTDSGQQTAAGLVGTLFEGLSFAFGQSPYVADSCDVLAPADVQTQAVLRYGDSLTAAIQYQGFFGSGSAPGKLVFLALPFETVDSPDNRRELMGRVLEFFSGISAIGDAGSGNGQLPAAYRLLPNYPNPFNPSTTVSFALPAASRVRLDVYNTLGQKLRTLVNGTLPAGTHRANWDGRDNNGQTISSGIYLIRFSATAVNSGKQYRQIRKVLFTK